MKRRVAVTGLGCISAIGHDVAEFDEALAAGRGGIGELTLIPGERLRCRMAAEVRGYASEDWFTAAERQRLERFAQFGVIAGRQALRDAGLPPDRGAGARRAIVMGASIGGIETIDRIFQRLYREGRNTLPPLSIPRAMTSAAVSALSAEFGFLGPCFSVSSACASAGHAIAQGFAMVRDGQADLALTGGSDASLSFGMIKAWEALRVLASDTCRPFSRDRAGMVLGEGAGALVLEPLDQALRRGAAIHAELLGCGMSSDAGDLTLPDPDGMARAMRAALDDAGLRPDEVDYINAHGTGTEANDRCETAAIHRVFGPHARRLAVSSTKSLHGHALGASGALEAIATTRALARQLAPPTLNYLGPDPACDLDCVPDRARPMTIRLALSNSFAFGGLNVAIALGRHSPTQAA